MKQIAIVEDEPAAAEYLSECLWRYGQSAGEEFRITRFSDGQAFLDKYTSAYDLVFMDIEMPGIDGMTAAERLRRLDEHVLLVFITHMAQLAIKGYSVNAFDFIVKPFSYPEFALHLKKILANLESRAVKRVKVFCDGTVRYLSASSVRWVEVSGHDLVYHTTEGELTAYGSLKNAEKDLGAGFSRCNSCYLVNLHYVTEVKGFEVKVGGDTLQISQPKRKEFMQALSGYLGSIL